MFGDAGDNGSLLRGQNRQLHQFFRLFDQLGRGDLRHPEFQLLEQLEVHQVLGGRGHRSNRLSACFRLLDRFFFSLKPREERFKRPELAARRQFPPDAALGERSNPRVVRGEPETCRHLRRRPRHHRRQGQGQKTETFKQIVEDGVQAAGLIRILGERPGFIADDVFVGKADQFPDCLKGEVKAELRHHRLILPEHGLRRLPQRLIFFVEVSGSRDLAVPVLPHHGGGPAEQVAQIVGQVGILPGHDRLGAERRVEAKGHLPQRKIPQGVDPVGLDQFLRPHDIADALRHLGVVDIPVAVNMELLVERQVHGHQHSRPVDGMWLEDILGDHMFGNGPEFHEIAAVRIAYAGQVIDQGVEPDVGDETIVEGQFDPPGESRLRPGDAQIFQGFAEKRQDLVAVALRRNELRVAANVVDQPLLVAGHPEKIVLFGDLLRRSQVVGAIAVDQLLFRQIALAASAIEAAVFIEIDIPQVIYLLQNALHHGHMGRIGGADEMIGLNVEHGPGLAEDGADPVDVFPRRDILAFRRFDDLVAMFVGARLKPHRVPAETPEPAVGVGDDRGIGMAEVRLCIHIVNRRGDICCHGFSQAFACRRRRKPPRRSGRQKFLFAALLLPFLVDDFFLHRQKGLPVPFSERHLFPGAVLSDYQVLQRYLPLDQVILVADPDFLARLRHVLPLLPVRFVLVGETTEQSIADPGNFSRVERQVLLLSHLDRHRIEILDKGRTAQLPAAGADPADHLGLVPDSHLTHFHPGPEFLDQVLDQAPEIDPAIRGEIENHFTAVEKAFDPDQIHAELVGFDQLAANLKGMGLAFGQPPELFALFVGCRPDNGKACLTFLPFAAAGRRIPGDMSRFKTVIGLHHYRRSGQKAGDRRDGSRLLAAFAELDPIKKDFFVAGRLIDRFFVYSFRHLFLYPFQYNFAQEVTAS